MAETTQKRFNKEIIKGDAFYDIEVLHNIFTCVEVLPIDGVIKYIVFIDDEAENREIKEIFDNNKDEILRRVGNELHQIIPSALDYLKTPILEYESFEKYKQKLSRLNEPGEQIHFDAPRYFGFNSSSYDMPMLAALVREGEFTTSTNRVLRLDYSDKLIESNNVYDTVKSPNNWSRWFWEFRNSKRFIDIKMFNETARFVSLKRLSAHAGHSILESDKLSGDTARVDTLEDIVELLVYNTVDSINTYLLFLDDAYKTTFEQRSDMLNRFEYEFNDKLSQDSTSANFISAVISPRKDSKREEFSFKYEDDERINVFFPTQLEKVYVEEFKKINAYKEKCIESYNLNMNNQTDRESLVGKYFLNEQIAKIMGRTSDQKLRFRYNPQFDRYEEDLLEYIKDEYGFPEEAYTMYDLIRGATSLKDASERIKRDEANDKYQYVGTNQIEPKIDVLVPKANAFFTLSVGGVHGGYVRRNEYIERLERYEKDLKDAEERLVVQDKLKAYFGDDSNGATTYLNTKRDDETPEAFSKYKHKDYVTGSYKNGAKWKNIRIPKRPRVGDLERTVEAYDVIHADVQSHYPTTISALKIFHSDELLQREKGNREIADMYTFLLDERLTLKASLPEDFTSWTAEDFYNDMIQRINKLLLNSASGILDATFDNNIRMNNKAMKMRMCGQLSLLSMMYELIRHGATPISINTDGVYVVGVNADEAKSIIGKWEEYFDMSADPEVIDHFISKDTNNRVEFVGGEVKDAGGSTLAHYKGVNMQKQPSKPTIVDNALLQYLKLKDNPLEEFDREALRDYMKMMIQMAKDHPEKYKTETLKHFQWVLVSNPSKHRYMIPMSKNEFYPPDKLPQTVNRAFFVKSHLGKDEVKMITIKKQNKETSNRAMEVLDSTGLSKERRVKQKLSESGQRANFEKVPNIELDNTIIVENGDLQDADIDILDKLDLDVYLDVLENTWLSWSEHREVIK